MRSTFTLLLVLFTCTLFAQSAVGTSVGRAIFSHGSTPKHSATKDTVIESDTTRENKEPQYFYISANTDIFVAAKGGVANRFSPAIEFGRTYGIFDLGLASGVTNSLAKGNDTTHYIELRPTINIFSKGRFNQGLCLGAGYIFNAKQAFMTEICNSINFNITTTVTVAITQGYYFFDGTNNSRSTQYVGFSLTYNFLKKHSTNRRRKRAAILSDN
ncbi:hypothetical protein [Mucilaginibacter sp.]